jgi:dipeptidyl aminopeptidase/acylaminoacyl peptidase
VFVSKGRDGKTDIWGMIVRPSHWTRDKKYPVIENIYAGPHDSHVPKNFMNYSSMHAPTTVARTSTMCAGRT